MDEKKVVADNSNIAEDVAPEATEDTSETSEENTETSEDLKARLAKAEELANNYKVRAEKAEKKSKETVEVKGDISSKDTIAIMRANVHEDDIDEVKDFAKLKGISIADALKSNVVKAIISDREDIRKTANATHTGTTRKSSARISDEELLEKASKGDIPEDDAGIERLMKARADAKRKK